jgi:hypothetical protein
MLLVNWRVHSTSPVFIALNRDIRYVHTYNNIYWIFFPIYQCVCLIFTDVNGARVPIWQTARQLPGQQKCQQKLLKLTMRT